jgi:hypothetical protein
MSNKEKTMSQAKSEFNEYLAGVRPEAVRDNLDPFRHYEAPGPDALPRAVFSDLELLAACRPLRIFTMRSTYPVEAVTAPGYFDGLADCRLRRHDRIELLADSNGEGTFATLCVDSVNKAGGEVRVSLLCRYERQH